MVEWLAGNRIRGTSTERTTGSGFNPISAISGGWVEVGRTTLGSTTTPITVSSLPDKRYYMVLKSWSGNTGVAETFNNDSGSNYAGRRNHNGGTDSTLTSQTGFPWANSGYSSTPNFAVDYISNLSSKEKLIQRQWMFQNTAGAGTAPQRLEVVAKWANTSNVINRMDMAGGNNYDSGSEVVVLGWDPADTHTTNFWEELYTDSGTSLDSGVAGITAKKYLWIQTYIGTPTATANHSFIFNGDTGSNYAVRYQIDGGADGTDQPRGDALIPHQGGSGETGIFANTFIINNSANEKLIISHEVVEKGTGAGAVPSRYEHVGKWANTSAQITDIALTGTYGATSEMRVWGSN